jgi:microcystin-dependent protein
MPVESFTGLLSQYPNGAILLWGGSLNDIPRGWVVCDGANGTPNLRNRFPKSVPDGTTDPGATGGHNSLTLSTSQMPSHSHSGSNVSTTGSHDHKPEQDPDNQDGPSGDDTYGADEIGSESDTVDADQQSSHSHGMSLNSTGGGSSIDNQPQHAELVFIQRV